MPEARRSTTRGSDAGLPVTQVHLADTSAWSKARNDPALTELFDNAVRSGFIATCEVVALELLRSARNHRSFTRQGATLAMLVSCEIGVPEVRRAREVQADLAAKGHHRGVKPPDLLVAAAAEAAGVPVLHYDHDYDLISSVTGQATRWLAPRGDLP
jgi:predicted nucleic acid-binding protein